MHRLSHAQSFSAMRFLSQICARERDRAQIFAIVGVDIIARCASRPFAATRSSRRTR